MVKFVQKKTNYLTLKKESQLCLSNILTQFCFTGLMTYPDGTHGLPRTEGMFRDHRLIRREKCALVIQKANQAAQIAYAQKLT